MPSSVIKRYDYDEQLSVLTVTFTNDRVYRYFGVPKSKYLALNAAPSRGRYFGDHIRDVHPFERVRD